MTMMLRKTVDAARNKRTMVLTGGEDTALLRSNRSAHAGAETQAGDCQSDRPLSLLMPAAFFATKRQTSGVWGRAPR